MRRPVLEWDEKDWVILRLLRLCTELQEPLIGPYHPDYCKAALWADANLDLFNPASATLIDSVLLEHK